MTGDLEYFRNELELVTYIEMSDEEELSPETFLDDRR